MIHEKIHEGQKKGNPLHGTRIVKSKIISLNERPKTFKLMKENHNTPGHSAENNCVYGISKSDWTKEKRDVKWDIRALL